MHAVALIVAATVLALPASAGATLDLGVHVEAPSRAELDRIALGGAGFVRAPIKWNHVQAVENGSYDWSEYDTFLTETASVGLNVLPVVVGSPRWAAVTVADQPTRRRSLRALSAFVRALTDRYRPGGAFWATRPELPQLPVRSWQLWNEPNSRHFWAGEPDASEYVSLLGRMARATRAADPDAQIVLAGMGEQREKNRASDFLRAMYAQKGFSKSFDVAAAHAYAKRPRGVETAVRRLRGVMDAAGDRRKPIWITEMGWASSGPSGDFRVTDPEGQAALLEATFGRMAQRASRLTLERITWYESRDRTPPETAAASWVYHVGFFEVDGDPKPAWSAFSSFAGGSAGFGPLPASDDP